MLADGGFTHRVFSNGGGNLLVRPVTTACGAKSLANAATTFRRRWIT